MLKMPTIAASTARSGDESSAMSLRRRLGAATRATALLALLLPLAACTPWATFPPIAGGNPLTPGIHPVPEVMAKALVYVHSKTDPTAPLVFNLPEGVQAGVWAGVATRIADLTAPTGRIDATPMRPGDRRVWSVEQVRVRGFRAEVDVVYLEQQVYQMATVHLEASPMQGFRVDFMQRWLIPSIEPVPHDPALRSEAADETGAVESQESAEPQQSAEPVDAHHEHEVEAPHGDEAHATDPVEVPDAPHALAP